MPEIKKRERYEIRNVPPHVKKAIAKYCEDKDITQAVYLEKDRRIKDFLK